MRGCSAPAPCPGSVDPEDLIFGKDLVQLGIERDRTCQIRAERLFHDDPGPLDEVCFRQQADGRQGGIGRHAQIVHTAILVAQFLLRRGDRRFEDGSARADRHIVQRLGKGSPVRLLHLSAGELIDCLARDLAEAIGVDLVQRDADDSATRNEPGARQVEQAGQQLPSRQVAGGTHKDNDLRMFGTNPRRNLSHFSHPPPGDARAGPSTKFSADLFRNADDSVQDFSAGRDVLLCGPRNSAFVGVATR